MAAHALAAAALVCPFPSETRFLFPASFTLCSHKNEAPEWSDRKIQRRHVRRTACQPATTPWPCPAKDTPKAYKEEWHATKTTALGHTHLCGTTEVAEAVRPGKELGILTLGGYRRGHAFDSTKSFYLYARGLRHVKVLNIAYGHEHAPHQSMQIPMTATRLAQTARRGYKLA